MTFGSVERRKNVRQKLLYGTIFDEGFENFNSGSENCQIHFQPQNKKLKSISSSPPPLRNQDLNKKKIFSNLSTTDTKQGTLKLKKKGFF